MGLFGSLIGGAVKAGVGAQVGKAQARQAQAAQVQQEREAMRLTQQDERQRQMDLLRMALDNSLMRDREADNRRQIEDQRLRQERENREFGQRERFHHDSESRADARASRSERTTGRLTALQERNAQREQAFAAVTSAARAAFRRGGPGLQRSDYQQIQRRYSGTVTEDELAEHANNFYVTATKNAQDGIRP